MPDSESAGDIVGVHAANKYFVPVEEIGCTRIAGMQDEKNVSRQAQKISMTIDVPIHSSQDGIRAVFYTSHTAMSSFIFVNRTIYDFSFQTEDVCMFSLWRRSTFLV